MQNTRDKQAQIKINWQNQGFILYIDTYKDPQSYLPRFDLTAIEKYQYVNKVCEYILAKLRFAYIIDIVFTENPVIPDSSYSFDLIMDKTLAGKIEVGDENYLQLLLYYFYNGRLIPKASELNFNLQLNVAGCLVDLKTIDNLFTPNEKATYMVIKVSNSRSEYNIYCLKDLFHKLANTILTEDPTGSLSNSEASLSKLSQAFIDALNLSFNQFLTIKKIGLSVLLPIQEYVEIEINCKSITGRVLLDNWPSQPGLELILKSQETIQNDFTLPFPLTHGETILSINEINNLQRGDIILFDNEYAPNTALINLHSCNYIFNWDACKLCFSHVETRR